VQIEPGFVIGHEYVGEVIAAGDDVSRVAVGDRVLGTYGVACGECFFCQREDVHKCDFARVFGHGKALGDLQGPRPSSSWFPHANLALRKVPEALSDDVALFAGDVMGTGFHAIDSRPLGAGETAAILGLGPVGLCAVQAAKAAGAAEVNRDRTRWRTASGWPSPSRATPVHLTEQDPRGEVRSSSPRAGASTSPWRRSATPRRSIWLCAWQRKAGTVSVTGVYAERAQVHMGVLWIKALTLTSGHRERDQAPRSGARAARRGRAGPRRPSSPTT